MTMFGEYYVSVPLRGFINRKRFKSILQLSEFRRVSVPLRGFINRKPGGGAGACGIYVSVPLRGFINRKP